jgi:hypothetical protein
LGSLQFTKATKQRRGKPGKVDASLSKKLQEVKWGEFKIGDLFDKIRTKSLRYKTSELPSKATKEFILPALTAGIQNQGLNNFVPKDNATILKNVISISANGANTGATFYQNKEFTILQDAYAIRWKFTDNLLTDNHYLYLTASISKVIFGNYEWTNKAGWERIKTEKIQLPIKNDKIDFDFMENFIAELEAERIAELEAYLSVTGLKDYTLTKEEQQALDDFEKLKWGIFNLEKLFGKSTRGKRLKSADRISGTLPFVTAGETNEGISAFVGNEVIIFSRNTITIDMFGSAKYRNYKYGADDHIAVVDTKDFAKFATIFVTAAIHRASNNGQFNYSRNFYAKDADELNILLPIKNGQPNYSIMETFISAIQKLVIKDVVLYANKKIAATKMVVQSENNKN